MSPPALVMTAVLLLAGCGRRGFDQLGDAGSEADADADGSANVDADLTRPVAPTFVQVAADFGPDMSTTGSVTYPADVTAGDLLLVEVNMQPISNRLVSVTDSAGNVYALTASGMQASLLSPAYFAYAIASTSGPLTVTATVQSAPSLFEIRAMEYANVSATPYDTVAWGGNTGASGVDGARTSDFVTLEENELIVSVVLAVGVPNSPGTGFTLRSTFADDIVQDRIATAPGTYAGFATTALDWLSGAIAIRGARR